MPSPSSVLVCGSLAWDTILDFPDSFARHILPERIHILNVSFVADRMSRNHGGTGGNIAYNLALLGVRPHLLASAGRDFGPYREWLERCGVDTSGVVVFEDEYTAAATIITDRDDNQITAFHGGAMLRNDIDHGGRIDPDRIALGIVSPDGKDGMHRRAREFKAAGIPVIMDPGQSIPLHSGAELRALIDGSQALIVNDYELQLVIDKTGLDERGLLALTPTVVVTLGGEGSRALDRVVGEVRVGAVPTANLVDPTGAGDAYRAGFLLGRLGKAGLRQCLQLGATAGVHAVESYGTQNHRPTRAEFRARYESTFGQWPLPEEPC